MRQGDFVFWWEGARTAISLATVCGRTCGQAVRNGVKPKHPGYRRWVERVLQYLGIRPLEAAKALEELLDRPDPASIVPLATHEAAMADVQKAAQAEVNRMREHFLKQAHAEGMRVKAAEDELEEVRQHRAALLELVEEIAEGKRCECDVGVGVHEVGCAGVRAVELLGKD